MARLKTQQNSAAEDITSSLTDLGFSRIEASSYAALVKNGKMNGYQLAKYLGISRPAAYDALESLLAKGCVYLMQSTSREFIPEDPSELFRRMKKQFCCSADSAMTALLKTADRSGEKLFINIEGLAQITAKISSMISETEKELCISGDFDLRPLAGDIAAAAEKGVRIIVFSFIDLKLDGLPVEFHSPRHQDNPACMDRRIMIVSDFAHSLIASSQGSPDWTGTFSENQLLAKIVSEHIHHDIYLLKLKEIHGENLIDKKMLLSSLMEKGTGM